MASAENRRTLGRRWADFWQRVTEGLNLQALWAQFREETQAGYQLYSREVDWTALEGESRPRRALRIAGAFFWAVLAKLSPARRLLLLLSLLFAFYAFLQAQGTGSGARGPLLLSVAALLVLLVLELADRITMKRDLEIAREIQRWLVPKEAPTIPGFELAFATRPANTVAGDYYDAFPRVGDGLSADRWLLVVADVAGKSLPAALLMATFQASLRTLAPPGPVSESFPLPELVRRLNRYACEHSAGGQRFTTAFLAELEPKTGELAYINAGHNPPLLFRADNQVERLKKGGLPLGIDLAAEFDSATVTLQEGDFLLVFTDGLVEALNEEGDEFGEPRILQVLRAGPPKSAGFAVSRLMAAVDDFVGQTRQHDDITSLLLRCL